MKKNKIISLVVIVIVILPLYIRIDKANAEGFSNVDETDLLVGETAIIFQQGITDFEDTITWLAVNSSEALELEPRIADANYYYEAVNFIIVTEEFSNGENATFVALLIESSGATWAYGASKLRFTLVNENKILIGDIPPVRKDLFLFDNDGSALFNVTDASMPEGLTVDDILIYFTVSSGKVDFECFITFRRWYFRTIEGVKLYPKADQFNSILLFFVGLIVGVAILKKQKT